MTAVTTALTRYLFVNNSVLSPLMRAQEMGGLVLKLPGENANTIYYPAIPFFLGDNKELNHLAAVRTSRLTRRQCRICLTESVEMNEFPKFNVFTLRARSQAINACNMLTRAEKTKELKDLSISEDIENVSVR
jgi:hypothetical protein